MLWGCRGFCSHFWVGLVSSVVGTVGITPTPCCSRGECCRLSFSTPGPVQSVQRAELWGVVLALQAARPVHLGVDNANVVGHVGRILAGKKPSRPFQILLDGDLLLLIRMLISARGEGSTSISKVKGHADDDLVRRGQVRQDDKSGNDLADEAADHGRLGAGAHICDARKDLIYACRKWYPIVRVLHRFFIAISRAVVNDDGKGGKAPDPMCWCAGSKPKKRKAMDPVRDLAMVPGPVGLGQNGSFKWPRIDITAADIGLWPFSTSALVKLAAFLSSLTWPSTVEDLGAGGASFIELLILYEKWAGERLRVEFSLPKYRRPGRPISVSVAPSCPDADIRNLCQFFATMMRALCRLPGGIGRFIPGRIGENHSRLRHVGWQKCCHGLSCRPLETSGEGVLSDLLSLLGYPGGSGAALLGGSLRLKYQTLPFARRKPTWKIPLNGGVANIIAAGGNNIDHEGDVFVVGGCFLGKSCKRVRLTKKTSMFGGSIRPIPGRILHDPVHDGDPGTERRVARRLLGSSPGDRLDRAGIG